MPKTTEDIESALYTIEGAIAEVRGSSKFKQLLGTMLGVGNKINAGCDSTNCDFLHHSQISDKK